MLNAVAIVINHLHDLLKSDFWTLFSDNNHPGSKQFLQCTSKTLKFLQMSDLFPYILKEAVK